MQKYFLLLTFISLLPHTLFAQDFEADFWTAQWLKYRKPKISNNGKVYQDYNNRNELDIKSKKYLSKKLNNYNFLNDPMMEDYLYQNLMEVFPTDLVLPGRYKDLNIQIIKSTELNVFSTHDGSIFITTGLLSLIENEDELEAILAHEVAHLVLDHNLKQYKTHKTTTTIGNIIDTAAMTAAAVNAEKKNYSLTNSYIATVVAGTLSNNATAAIQQVIGASYSRNDETAADKIAQEWLITQGKDKHALGRVLERAGKHYTRSGSKEWTGLLDSHPSLKKRLKKLEYISSEPNPDYRFQRMVVPSLQALATIEIHNRNFELASELLDKIIASQWPTEEAYLLKANISRHLQNTNKSNKDALALLNIENQDFINFKPEREQEKGLLFLRMEEYSKALAAFEACERYLVLRFKETQEYNKEQLIWTRQMIARCKTFTNKQTSN
ncbi:M48 family metallopeptidase [Limibacter armeniacum]|uniref:M48 family metallopeptidase n=1 Tax=Limibacter armeniacum TaxID=466084 RepID=UPI002FE5C5F0